ncbi:MAG: TetR/AcrR family transcriptional regulator C-terminal domain-containing protein [Actinomycetota bacterium]|nr:TetR/AcrR family transcriptional regulator C-terminal domain-containing protein [Actinomycetota bacterium]
MPLSRDSIIHAAIGMIDDSGTLDSLTMRSLGSHLGFEAMALYRYINGREDLLEGIVDTLVEQIRTRPEDDGDLEPALTDEWQGMLQWTAHCVRQIAVDHPAIFPLIATRHPAAPWLRPPLRSLRVVEDLLHALTRCGFTDRQAVATYRIFSSFLLGHLLLEAATRGASTAPVEEPLDEGDADVAPPSPDLEVSDYPTIARTASMLTEDHTQEEFESALEALLDRLDRQLSQ